LGTLRRAPVPSTLLVAIDLALRRWVHRRLEDRDDFGTSANVGGTARAQKRLPGSPMPNGWRQARPCCSSANHGGRNSTVCSRARTVRAWFDREWRPDAGLDAGSGAVDIVKGDRMGANAVVKDGGGLRAGRPGGVARVSAVLGVLERELKHDTLLWRNNAADLTQPARSSGGD